MLAAPPNRRTSVRSILETFWAQLCDERSVDFEMILRYAWEMVRDNPSMSILLSGILKFILVDEIQGTKEIQYAVVGSILKAGRKPSWSATQTNPFSHRGAAMRCRATISSSYPGSRWSRKPFHHSPVLRAYRSVLRQLPYSPSRGVCGG